MTKIAKTNKKVFIFLSIAIIVVAVIATTVFFRSRPAGDSVAGPIGSSETYSNQTYSFSLRYPSALKVSSFRAPDDSGDIVLISGDATSTGMQISIAPFDEDLQVLTPARIKQDLPDLVIIDPQDVTLGSMGKGVAFLDGSAATAHRQVWFVANKQLYQITAPVSFDSTMKEILNTWTFF